ncbi:MAG: hypothetical protein Q4F29_03705, partial [Lachnospiraceae bacterium]|nr:hypothetical protein [Lachnospiraceae bacterium]
MDEQLFNQKPDDTQEPKTAGQPYDEKQAEAPAETTSTHAADIPANEAPAAPAKDAAAAPESEPASENPSPAA